MITKLNWEGKKFKNPDLIKILIFCVNLKKTSQSNALLATKDVPCVMQKIFQPIAPQMPTTPHQWSGENSPTEIPLLQQKEDRVQKPRLGDLNLRLPTEDSDTSPLYTVKTTGILQMT